MSLRNYQQEILPFVLYSVTANPVGNGSSLMPYIEVRGDPVQIYSSSQEPGAAPDFMVNNTPDRFSGIMPFSIIPNYLYITEEDGAESIILLSGVKADIVSQNKILAEGNENNFLLEEGTTNFILEEG